MKYHRSKLKLLLIRLGSFIPFEKIINFLESIRIERLRRKIHRIGDNTVIGNNFFVEAPHKLVIEDNVSFARNVRIMGVGGTHIKRDTMIASGVAILTTTHDSREKVMRGTGIHKPVTIGQSVWIGANATILPGVTIHNNAIVGAGSVVTKEVKEGEVVVGPYAEIIRRRDLRN
jgi:acetyltransferase-like isoleucine patch superfamily enzyme